MVQKLRQAGVEPRQEITTEDYLAMPHLVAGASRIALTPARVAALAPSTGEALTAAPAAFASHLNMSI
ncbi:hypothetical protein [Nonomuraea sp. NPDC050783]|uniref:hypothetical protein n=1 Tax=Nonomuraea sp. NPDC050783 TaxID=3154634 RepID=UPI0034657FE5